MRVPSRNGLIGITWNNSEPRGSVLNRRVLQVGLYSSHVCRLTLNSHVCVCVCVCDLVRPGWSFRVQDAIYAGCIPVFLADGTHYPFADVLDWAKFSVRLSPTDLDHVEEILREIPIEQVEAMQAHLVAVREAFLYSSDESPGDELDRMGPLFFALHSARIRLVTRYPFAS